MTRIYKLTRASRELWYKIRIRVAHVSTS